MEKDRVFGEPDNPVATVLTDMVSRLAVIPQYLYTEQEGLLYLRSFERKLLETT